MSDGQRSGKAGQWKYMDAVREALAAEMEEDETVFLAGIDVGASGGIFAVTRGLQEKFGKSRVRDSPISETALVGLGVGAAMAGYRPVIEIMFMDFISAAFDPLLNQAPKLRYMTGGKVEMPLVVRTQVGTGQAAGAQHSQSLEALLAHIPGLRVVMPSTVSDTAALLRGAIRDPHPVIFVENRRLYGRREPRPAKLPEPDVRGEPVIRREGTDLTVVTWSRLLWSCLEAADTLSSNGISAEVIDVRTVAPMMADEIVASVRRTGRLLIVHEAVRAFGAGAEYAAHVVEHAFDDLRTPPVRIGGASTPVPFSPALESEWVPSTADILEAATALVQR